MTATIKALMTNLPQQGTLQWIGLRPARREAMHSVSEVRAETASGLVGDRYAGRSGTRQVTLIQAEHLPVIASLLHRDNVPPEMMRRNLVVSGISLLALKGRQFSVGGVVMEHTGACHPCSRMEEYFGPGGYNATRGHGGITARVLSSGVIAVGDSVKLVTPAD